MTKKRIKNKRGQPNENKLSTPNQLRYLQLSTNVNDYDTGETETATEKDKKTESSSVTSKKTGDKFQDLEK
jgi:hypothetical protein